MKVLLYAGNLKTVEKSGVGKAVKHQEEALRYADIPYTYDESQDYDVVHLNTIFPDSYLMGMRAKRRGKKVIYYGHSTMEDFRNSFKGSNQAAPAFKWWIKKCYGIGDLVITPTEYSKNILKSYGMRVPVTALTNGIDLENYQRDEEGGRRFRRTYGLQREDRVVIGVGHYMKRKGILDFVEAAKRLPQYQFLWFGYTDPVLVPKEVQEAVKTDLPNLRFPGFVDQEELKDAYSGSDLFFFPTYEETEGIVLLEAMAMRLPVLVRDIPIYESWLPEGQVVYKGKTVEDFQQRIAAVLEGRLADLTEEAHRCAESHSIPSVSRRLCTLYENMGLLTDMRTKVRDRK